VGTDSAWTWAYFFAGDADAVRALAADRKYSLTRYRVERVAAVRGDAGVSLDEGATLVRLEVAARLPSSSEKAGPRLLFHGLPQHLQYTTHAQRDDLAKRSRAEVPASADTVAVIIPIRKSAAWWALPHDDRQAHFRSQDGRPGHTAIGAEYADRIYRKLYHSRYAAEAGHDFITYFEFRRAHEADFRGLLASLRDTEKNPEWGHVDREYEIWMTKVE
jgi:hypothetical protein